MTTKFPALAVFMGAGATAVGQSTSTVTNTQTFASNSAAIGFAWAVANGVSSAGQGAGAGTTTTGDTIGANISSSFSMGNTAGFAGSSFPTTSFSFATTATHGLLIA